MPLWLLSYFRKIPSNGKLVWRFFYILCIPAYLVLSCVSIRKREIDFFVVS